MIDWRELMPSVPACVDPRNHPQNPQNPPPCRGFEDIEDEFQALKSCGEPPATKGEWIQAWGELVIFTKGMEKTDPRYQTIMTALEQCDQAFESGSWWNFQKAASALKGIMRNQNT